MSDLHSRIMNIPCRYTGCGGSAERLAYKEGHRDARHDAAELSLATDAELHRLREALERIERWELPPTGKFFSDEVTPSTYEYEYGSNGARDYIRRIAREAIAGVTNVIPNPTVASGGRSRP